MEENVNEKVAIYLQAYKYLHAHCLKISESLIDQTKHMYQFLSIIFAVIVFSFQWIANGTLNSDTNKFSLIISLAFFIFPTIFVYMYSFILNSSYAFLTIRYRMAAIENKINKLTHTKAFIYESEISSEFQGTRLLTHDSKCINPNFWSGFWGCMLCVCIHVFLIILCFIAFKNGNDEYHIVPWIYLFYTSTLVILTIVFNIYMWTRAASKIKKRIDKISCS